MSKENTAVAKGAEKHYPETVDDAPVYLPPTDIYEEDDTIMIISDMPGVSDKDLEVTLENDTLTVVGKQHTPESDKHQILHRGYRPGTYKRSFNILTEVDRDKIKATLVSGILTVTLPKSEETKPKKIKVNVN